MSRQREIFRLRLEEACARAGIDLARFDPGEARDPHSGEWTKGAAGVAAAKGFLDSHYGRWRESLSPAQDKGLRFYQSPGFALMNGLLRGADPAKLKASEHASDGDLDRARKATRDLTAAIRKAPPLPRDLTTYRGMDPGQFGKLSVGQVITDPGFVSTSITKGAGAVGRAAKSVEAELALPAGTRAAGGSARELILAPGSSFRVVSVRPLKLALVSGVSRSRLAHDAVGTVGGVYQAEAECGWRGQVTRDRAVAEAEAEEHRRLCRAFDPAEHPRVPGGKGGGEFTRKLGGMMTPRGQMPPRPGTRPIPPGSIRLWHYTPLENVDSIRREGLGKKYARGDAGNYDQNDPSAGVWASTRRPDDILNSHDRGSAVVEYYATPDQISQNAESPWQAATKGGGWDDAKVADWASGYHHVIMRGDVPPDQIVDVHEPWHSAGQYMLDDKAGLGSYQWVLDQYAKDPAASPELAPYVKALNALGHYATSGARAG